MQNNLPKALGTALALPGLMLVLGYGCMRLDQEFEILGGHGLEVGLVMAIFLWLIQIIILVKPK